MINLDIPVKKGDTLYLHEWKSEVEMNVVPRKIICISKLSAGQFSYEIYFESSYNKSRPIVQLGKTMFLTENEANIKREEWYKENHLVY